MYDLVVIGGGSGGLNVASAAARVGAKVALIEKGRLGGECTYTACVPSKTLIHAARSAHEARSMGALGLKAGPVEVDFAAVMARVHEVVGSFGGSDSGESLKAKGIDVYRGSPAFEAYDTVVIDGQARVMGHRFVIATGSRPAIPDVPGLAEAGYLDNATFWDLRSLPASLLVLGAGPVGLELGQALARLGTKVTILSDSDRVLPHEDPDVSNYVQARLTAEGVGFHMNVKATSFALKDGQKVCSFRHNAANTVGQATATHLLVATGRLANVEGLNLDAAGVHASAEHGIEVDDFLQTRSRHILAIGDVLMKDQYTHAAEREASIAFQNAVLRLSKRFDDSAMPRVTFTDPEVASVGRVTADVSSEEASEARLFRASYEDLDRARIDGLTGGFAKVWANHSGKILGATIVGAEAGMILQEFVLAMENGLTLTEIANTVHSYPTYAGMARKLANQFVATRLEGGLVQTALRWFFGFRPRNDNGAEAVPQTEAVHTGHDH